MVKPPLSRSKYHQSQTCPEQANNSQQYMENTAVAAVAASALHTARHFNSLIIVMLIVTHRLRIHDLPF